MDTNASAHAPDESSRLERRVQVCGDGRKAWDAAVGALERLPVGRNGMIVGSEARVPRSATMDPRERLPVGREHVQVCGGGRASPGS